MLDYTHLMQMPTRDLIDRARMVKDLPDTAAQIMRALADTLEDHMGVLDHAHDLETELAAMVCDRNEWRDEAQSLERQLARVPTP